MKIFIVEDEGIIALELKLKLKHWNHEVVGTANNHMETLEQISKKKPDLILMDIFLANNEDGIELAKKINAKLEIPIIFMTGNVDMVNSEIRGYSFFKSVIEKPIKQETLKSAIDSIVLD